MSIFVSHKVCCYCGKIGHKKDMEVQYLYPDATPEYYHEECRKEWLPEQYCKKCGQRKKR